MKRILFLSLLFVLIMASTVQALSWAILFVVWDGKVYEVKQEIVLDEKEIGEVIGKVETQPDEMTGEYYGNASNYYGVGTKYYEIKGIPTSEAIAVEDAGSFVKAVYDHKAPFHIMNVVTNPFFVIAVIGVGLMLVAVLFRRFRNR